MTEPDVHQNRRRQGATALPIDVGDLQRWAVACVLVALTLDATVRVLTNLPGGGPAVAYRIEPLAHSVGRVLPAAGALAVGVVTVTWPTRIGLLTAGVFGLLGGLQPSASVPAAGALVAAGTLLVGDAVSSDPRGRYRTLFGAFLVVALALSLGSATSVLPTGARRAGSIAFFAAAATTPLLTRPTWTDWLLGGTVAVAVLGIGLGVPYVTGAVVLVVGNVVDTSLLVLAVGLGGATTAVSSAITDARYALAAGVALLAVAGVPATVPRATAALVALAAVSTTMEARQ